MEHTLGRIVGALVAALIVAVSRWTLVEWQFWFFVCPICIYVGVLHAIAFPKK